jgi:hypothetical protein
VKDQTAIILEIWWTYNFQSSPTFLPDSENSFVESRFSHNYIRIPLELSLHTRSILTRQTVNFK